MIDGGVAEQTQSKIDICVRQLIVFVVLSPVVFDSSKMKSLHFETHKHNTDTIGTKTQRKAPRTCGLSAVTVTNEPVDGQLPDDGGDGAAHARSDLLSSIVRVMNVCMYRKKHAGFDCYQQSQLNQNPNKHF